MEKVKLKGKCKVYDTCDSDDMEQCHKDHSESWIKKCQNMMKKPVGTKPVKVCTFVTGDVCPDCGSINYYQSGTCKTCRDCGFAGGCG